MKKILLGLLFIFFVSLPVSAQINDIQKDAVNLNAIYPTDSAANVDNLTGEHVKSFDSNVNLNKDGTIDVKETIVYDFADLQKHGIYRDIPFIKTNQDGKKYKLEFTDFSVQDENENDYRFTISSINEKFTRLKIGDADRLVTGVHIYIIKYKVSGAMAYFSDHDELYWNATGNEWTVSIASSTAMITLPTDVTENKGICFTGIYGSKESLCSVNDASSSISVKSDRILGANEGLSFDISFPKGIVAVLEPKVFVSFWDSWMGMLVLLLLGLLSLIWYVGLPFFIIYRWFRYGRDPKSTVGTTTAWFDPPKTQDGKRFLTPGEVGALGDETVDMKDISATIVDLARRGYLMIDERKKGDFYLVKKKKIDSSLLQYERSILSEFFGNEDEIRIKDKELSTEVAKVKKEMYEQVVENKMFDKNPETTRTKYYILAGIALFTSNFFLAIVAFLFGRVMPKKTIYGVEAKNISLSLKNFLSSQKRQLEFQADKQMMFERLLPFAVAFGVERIWAKRFESLNLTQPSWYHSYSGANFNSYLLVNSLNSSFKSMTAAATPTRSSSGFSSGFGGGGFSGGGGGGGGGGSW
jgi:uncharacterized membrane protein